MLQVAEQWFDIKAISDRITVIIEPHVAIVEQANMWLVRGRDYDLLVDAGMGICSLKNAISHLLDKPVIAVATHTHMDHVGSLHEFEHRLIHPAEAHILKSPSDYPVLCATHWPKGMRAELEKGYDVPDVLIDALPTEDFDPMAFRTVGTEPTRLVEEGDTIELGDATFEVIHLPGHTAGGIGIWEEATGTLFTGDTIYDGPLLDEIVGSDIDDYVATMKRLKELPVEVVHAGHDPSFGRERLHELIDSYLATRC